MFRLRWYLSTILWEFLENYSTHIYDYRFAFSLKKENVKNKEKFASSKNAIKSNGIEMRCSLKMIYNVLLFMDEGAIMNTTYANV